MTPLAKLIKFPILDIHSLKRGTRFSIGNISFLYKYIDERELCRTLIEDKLRNIHTHFNLADGQIPITIYIYSYYMVYTTT